MRYKTAAVFMKSGPLILWNTYWPIELKRFMTGYAFTNMYLI